MRDRSPTFPANAQAFDPRLVWALSFSGRPRASTKSRPSTPIARTTPRVAARLALVVGALQVVMKIALQPPVSNRGSARLRQGVLAPQPYQIVRDWLAMLPQ